MRSRRVVLEQGAKQDLADLYRWIADAASPVVADRYLDRVLDFIDSLDIASERGALHTRGPRATRTIGFEGRMTIAFRVFEEEVQVIAVFRGGKDWASELADR